MKQGFQILGILTLLIGSIIYTDKVGLVSKMSDDLLTEINEKSDNYEQKSVAPIINGDTIIPGKNGREVDVRKSYQKMRQIGYFNEMLLVYKETPIKKSLDKNRDKFIISGSKSEKSVTLIFRANNNHYLDNIVSVLKESNIKATFFIDSEFLEANYNDVIKLIMKGHTVGNLSNKGDYMHSDFAWMKTIIVNAGSQHNNYCYAEKKDTLVLKTCSAQSSYTIIPTAVISNMPFINAKNNLTEGAMLSFYINPELDKEIVNIINYIKGKGYKIKSLENLLKE